MSLEYEQLRGKNEDNMEEMARGNGERTNRSVLEE